MGRSRCGALAVVLVVLLLGSALGPFMLAGAAPTLLDNTVLKGVLTDASPRADYNFTARPNEWTVVASNNYEGQGSYKHSLRINISALNPIASVRVGSISGLRQAGLLAINGYDLPVATVYTVAQERGAYTPSFALQLKRAPAPLSRVSRTVNGSLGLDGVVAVYQISLLKRDTLDLRLRVPAEWTYNYHFALLVLEPAVRYHQFEGEGGAGPVAMSDAGANKECALTYLAMDPGMYCIVILNEGMPDDIAYSLEVGLNGLPLAGGALDEETLTDVNQVDYYSMNVPVNKWSAVVAKARGTVDYPATHSLHWPTADSNTIAYDTLTDKSPAGILAINGYEMPGGDMFFAREKYDPRGKALDFTVQYSTSTSTLPSTNTTLNGTLTSSDIFRMYEIRLQKAQTVDLRLRVATEYNYDYDLGMYVFAPGGKYYSISGELPEYAMPPVAWSRAGKGTEQDAVFTCPETGYYAIAVVNFEDRDAIPFTLQVTIQGKSLLDDSPVKGDLNAQNRADLFQFVATRNQWNVVGCRLDDGAAAPDALDHRLHSTALDTNPILDETVGWVKMSQGREGQYDRSPLGLLGIDGRLLGTSTTYYLKEEVAAGTPHYVLELENTPRKLTSFTGTLAAQPFKVGEFLHTYSVDLALHQSLDVRVAPPANYTYDYELGVYILGPGELYHGLGSGSGSGSGSGPGVVASSVPGMSLDPALMYVAEKAGNYLIVVANLGPLSGLTYDLRYAVDGFNTTIGHLTPGTLDEVNSEDGYRFTATTGDWTLVVVRLPESDPATSLVASIRWPTLDSVPLSSATLSKKSPIAAFVINGDSLPPTTGPHYVDVTGAVPTGRTLRYEVQVSASRANLTGQVQNLTDEQAGALYTAFLTKGSTADLALRVPPDYTYAYDLELYLFGPGTTYMTTASVEAGPRSWSRGGGNTEQEVVYTAPVSAIYGVVVLCHGPLHEVAYNLSATVDGAPLEGPARGYVDSHNRNEQYRFTAPSNQWSVLAARYLGLEAGAFYLKLLTNGLSTNPVVNTTVSPAHSTGVIAINGWDFDAQTRVMFANLSHKAGYAAFVVHAAANATPFGEIGHSEAAAFGVDQIVYIYQIDLVTADHLELQLAYDQGNWSSDVLLDLLVFEPFQSLGSAPVKTVTLMVTEGHVEVQGLGELIANKTGTYAFVLVNHGPLGPLGFTLGVYRRTVLNQPPAYPAILKASTTKNKITVEWAPNQEPDFQKYEVYLSSTPGDRGKRIDTITTQTLGKYTFERLDPDQTYYVTVVTYDTEGLYTQSNAFKVKTKPLPWFAQPEVIIIIVAIIATVLTLFIIDRAIRWQRAKEVETPAMAASAEVAGADTVMPAPAPTAASAAAEAAKARPPAGEDDATRMRREAIDYMKRMQGDE
jgi:hypothetical protein